MSLELLKALNGRSDGEFSRLLRGMVSDPKICWYPSAGDDFRDVLYLSQAYSVFNPSNEEHEAVPDIFIHTDFLPLKHARFLYRRVLHSGIQTTIIADHMEELPGLSLPLVPGLAGMFRQGGEVSGKVYYMRLHIKDYTMNTAYSAHLIYAFVENGAFCADMLLKHSARLSHAVHVRFGGGLGGGGTAAGGWMVPVLPKLACEMFISDGRHDRWQSGDHLTMESFPALGDTNTSVIMEPTRTIPSKYWGDYGDVSWLHLTYAPKPGEAVPIDIQLGPS
jgi:hypothetical protein